MNNFMTISRKIGIININQKVPTRTMTYTSPILKEPTGYNEILDQQLPSSETTHVFLSTYI